MEQSERIRDLLAPAVSEAGLELWDVEMGRGFVRVLVDRPGGINLDALAGVASEIVSPILDGRPELTPEGNFQLEVSSPGLERTLRTVDQFCRYLGSEVTAKTTVAIHDSRRHTGTLLEADEQTIHLHPKDTPPGTVIEIRMDQIERVRTVLSWGASPSPSAKRPAKHSGAPRRAAAAGASAAPDSKDTAS